jgi:NAD(P)H-dependent flavin oxidoreductase YrpB (nitropropane dioxygenase family)
VSAPTFPDTSFMRAFHLTVPIVLAPMGGVAGPRLVAAAANAGALAILPIWFGSPAAATNAIARTRALTKKSFAVNLRADLAQHDLIAAAIDGGVSIIHLFWGDPAPSMPAIRRAGVRMIATVSDSDTTKAALDAGAVALIAQGVEAGGHVFGTTALAILIPRVFTEAAGTVPVAAAGGIMDADDVVRVLKLGASAAVLGTRLVATEESEAHADYKRALINARAGDTVLSTCFDGFWPNAAHRTLKNSTFRAWDGAGRPPAGARPGEGDIVMRIAGVVEVPRYHATTPTESMNGDCEPMALYAGTGVGNVMDIRPAGDVIKEIAIGVGAKLLTPLRHIECGFRIVFDQQYLHRVGPANGPSLCKSFVSDLSSRAQASADAAPGWVPARCGMTRTQMTMTTAITAEASGRLSASPP